jgi:hypothetical protein
MRKKVSKQFRQRVMGESIKSSAVLELKCKDFAVVQYWIYQAAFKVIF